MRNMMGSWPFVFSFFGIMALWVIVNTVFLQHILSGKAFDPYPYILLNLFLSMLAGVQAAALLIAAKRADAISSEIAIHTEHNTDDIKTLIAENTALTSQVKNNTDLLDEIHLHVANIGKKVGAYMGNFPPGNDATGNDLTSHLNRGELAREAAGARKKRSTTGESPRNSQGTRDGNRAGPEGR